MYEKEKLEEAKYFYGKMVKHRNDEKSVCYNLSAFLSASRSIMQYALKEAKTKNNGQYWFDNHINNSPVFKFFKDKRDINIHTEPITPTKNVNVTIRESLHLSGTLNITVRDSGGNIKRKIVAKEPKKRLEKPTKKIENTFTYKFSDWTGTEDVEILGRIYLQELEKFIKDGISKSFIIG